MSVLPQYLSQKTQVIWPALRILKVRDITLISEESVNPIYVMDIWGVRVKIRFLFPICRYGMDIGGFVGN